MRHALFALTVLAVACNGSPTQPSPYTETINGSIASNAYLSHVFTTPRAGTMTVTLNWTAGADRDLDLYLTSAACADIYGLEPCTLLEESFAVEGTSETISRAVAADEAFRIWVDSFSSSNHSYTLNIAID
jgi:hypothetical protein